MINCNPQVEENPGKTWKNKQKIDLKSKFKFMKSVLSQICILNFNEALGSQIIESVSKIS